ncbi:MAG: hypothetical protein FWG14_06195 [Peptococcaceae bacterium]|nr:hypothetical protein [Peptococcaceae bacterium]
MNGCAPSNQEAHSPGQQTMMSYMEKKYGETFTFVDDIERTNHNEIFVTSDNLPNEYIRVHMDKESQVITDNYICFLMQSQLNNYISSLVESVYGPNQVFTNTLSEDKDILALMPESVGPNLSIDEYVKNIQGQIYCHIYLYADETTRDDDLEILRSALEARGCRIVLDIYYVKELSVIGQIEETRQLSYWEKENINLCGYFSMDQEYQLVPVINQKWTPSNQEVMMSYMEKKYGETFTFSNMTTESYGQKETQASGSMIIGGAYDEIRVSSDKLKGKSIQVHMDKKSKIITDNYICYLLRPQLNEYMSQLIESIYGPNQVFSRVPEGYIAALMPEAVGPDLSIDEYVKYIQDHTIFIDIYLYANKSTREKDLETLRSALEIRECRVPSLTIYYVNDPSMIGQITEKKRNSSDWEVENTKIKGSFKMDREYQFVWDGKKWLDAKNY